MKSNPVLAARCAPPSPRVRGVRVRGVAAWLRKSRIGPLTWIASQSTSTRAAGRGGHKISFSRRDPRPRFANNHDNTTLLKSASGSRMIPKSGVRFSDKIMRQKEGSGAPKGACRPLSAPHWQTSPSDSARARKRAKPGRARLPALRRGTRQGSYPLAQLRAALPGITGCKREAPRRQCSKHLAGQVIVPAGTMPEAARVRIGNSARGDRSRSTLQACLPERRPSK